MQHLKTIATLVLVPAYAVVSIASPAIGVATGFQDLTVNYSHLRGNATLFEGNSFLTGAEGARMDLSSGASVRLASKTKGIVYHDRIEMQSGSGEIRSSGFYRVDALSLHVSSAGQSSVARVSVVGNTLRVGAVAGNLQVLNRQGLLIARVAEGKASEFTPVEDGASAASAGASTGSGAAASGASSGSSAGAAGVAGASGAIVAGHTALIVAGVIVAGAGLASGVAVAATSGSSPTLSPSAR